MVFATTLPTIVVRATGSIAAVAKSTAVTFCGAFSLTQPQISDWIFCFCVVVIRRVAVCAAGRVFCAVVHFALIAILSALPPSRRVVLGASEVAVGVHADKASGSGASTPNSVSADLFLVH